MKWTVGLLALGLLVGCGGGKNSVRIGLPLPPKLDLSNYDYVFFPGFISDVKNENFTPDREAINFFRREFTRRNIIGIIDREPVDLDGKDPRSFFDREQPFFKQFNFDQADATLAVTGVISFEVLDRSGFRRVQDTDLAGRTFYRNQFVEATGFNLNMRVFVYDLEGRLLYRELLRDAIDLEGENFDEKLVYYDLLSRISNRVLGLFSNTVVKAERALL